MEFQLREKIDNQYTVLEKYRGGMSVVYIVLDEFSQKRFAVNREEEMLEDRTAVDRFAQEARTWMNLGRHPTSSRPSSTVKSAGSPSSFSIT